MMLFSFDELDAGTPSDAHVNEQKGKQSIHKSRLDKYDTITIENLQDLTGQLPSPGEIFFLWSLKSFNAFSFIKYVITERGKLDELVLSTYNITKVIFETLMRLVDNGLVTHLHLTLSDVAKTRFPQIYDLVNGESAKRDQVEVLYMWNHSKVSLMRTGDDHFIVEGSGNFSENSRHEQYIFMNSKEIYEFRREWIRNRIH
jgi:hypothetical protein